jgi:autotransporter-associated beta strand protein
VTLGGNATIKSISGLLTLSNAASIAGGTFGTTVDGAGDTTITGTIVGTTSNATFTKTGDGTATFSGAAANTYAGVTTVQGGTLVLAKTAGINAIPGNVTIGDGTGTDVVQLTNSNQIVDTSVVSFNGSGANAGTLRLNNQSETIAGLSSTGGAGIVENESGTAATSTLTVNVTTGTQVFSGVIRNGNGVGIDGTVALVKSGAGVQELSGTSTYTGATNVNAGELVVSGSLSGNVAVAAGAIISGGNNSLTSQIGALTTASTTSLKSIVAPGRTGGSGLTSAGILNVDGNVTLGTSLTETTRLQIEIGGATAGTQHDRLNVLGANGTVSLTNSTLEGGAINGYTFTLPTFNGGTNQYDLDGQVYWILTLDDSGSSLGGTKFANTLAPDVRLTAYDSIILGGQAFAINYTANFATSDFSIGAGNDVAIMAIPEPHTMSMLAGSLGLALGLQRFRRRRHASSVA